MVSLPVFSIASRSMVTTGLAFSASTRRMREPVTSMRSRVVACWSVGAGVAGGVVSWANAMPVPARAVVPTASAKVIASRSLVVFKVISLSK